MENDLEKKSGGRKMIQRLFQQSRWKVCTPELGGGSDECERKARQTKKEKRTGPGCRFARERVESKAALLKRIAIRRRYGHTMDSELSKDQINVQSQGPGAGGYVVKKRQK